MLAQSQEEPPAGLQERLRVCPPAQGAALQLADFESQLLYSPDVKLKFHTKSSGAIASDMNGSLRIRGAHRIELKAHGKFDGKKVDLSLKENSKGIVTKKSNQLERWPASEHLREALIVTFVRLGLLHNLALLVEGKPPQSYEGGIREWVQDSDEKYSDPCIYISPQGLPSTDWFKNGLAFDVTVAGQKTTSEELRFSQDFARHDVRLLYRRLVTVHFPQGDMRVVEQYEW